MPFGQLKMTHFACPQCNGSSCFSFTAHDTNRRMSNDLFDFYRCSQCHLIFLAPIPNDLGNYYPTEYYEIPATRVALVSLAAASQGSKLDIVRRFHTSGRLLEIGPAYGLFSYLAKSNGFNVTAVEMDDRCVDYLRSTLEIQVVHGLASAELIHALPLFDVIVMWQVIEHLADPWSFLDELAKHLAPGGVLIIDTPNPNSFQFRLLGGHWTHVDAPRHTTLIPASVMTTRLERHGLTCCLLETDGPIAIGYNSFGWAHSLKNLFVNEMGQRIAFFFGRVLAKLLAPVERTGSRGSTYTAVFKKAVKT
jgi:2-polyprenyl-3-methyl-5-hydroxy-6-metoxy-1,4-benzoquinol methylase